MGKQRGFVRRKFSEFIFIGCAFCIALPSAAQNKSAASSECFLKGHLKKVYLDFYKADDSQLDHERVFIEDHRSQQLIEIFNQDRTPISLKLGQVIARGHFKNKSLIIKRDDSLGLRSHKWQDDFISFNECQLPQPQVEILNSYDFPSEIKFESSVEPKAFAANDLQIALGDTFKLHSLPSSPIKIYLDFDGHTSRNNRWNEYFRRNPIVHPGFSLDGSDAFDVSELEMIQEIWQQTSEAFAPFNIDVTTEDPGPGGLSRDGFSDKTYGMRIIVTREASSNGGIAFMNSFTDGSDVGGFVYHRNLGLSAKVIAHVAAHEAGHALGLNHDGQGKTVYYNGHGSGYNSWSPIMGSGYHQSIIQWSRGEYLNANNHEDDLSIITSNNIDVKFRIKDHGGNFSQAQLIGIKTSSSLAQVETFGIIAGSPTTKDVDFFAMNVRDKGTINLTIQPATEIFVSGNPNDALALAKPVMLDLKATIYNQSGQVVYVANNPNDPSVSLKLTRLSRGTYYLVVEGTGVGTPLSTQPTGYTDYGSLGPYLIQGTYTAE